jgi:bifunctional aspartokinase / homoserine dehydrogenase 1
MRVHTIGSVSLHSPSHFADMIGIINQDAARDSVIVVPSSLPDVRAELRAAAAAAAAGDSSHEGVLKDIEARHFEIARHVVDLKRQSQVIASIRQQFNLLDDLIGGIALIRDLSPRTLDMVLGFGPWLSAYLFCEGFRELRPDVRFLDARQFLVTDHGFTQAKIRLDESRSAVQARIEQPKLHAAVVAARGGTPSDEVTTFGRGSSRYAASALAAMLHARELVIWTDTDGIMTADPRKVPAARSIPCTSYLEAMEMMHFGGEFLYPPALTPAVKQRIPIRVVNSFRPEHPGTLLVGAQRCTCRMTGLSSLEGVALLQIRGSGLIGVTGAAMRLFAALAGADVNVILISQASSEQSICVGIREADAARARAAVEEAFRDDLAQHALDEISVEGGLAILAVVGENIRGTIGVASTIFGALGAAQVNVRAAAQGSSALNVSIVIDADDELPALNALHRALFEDAEAKS